MNINHHDLGVPDFLGNLFNEQQHIQTCTAVVTTAYLEGINIHSSYVGVKYGKIQFSQAFDPKRPKSPQIAKVCFQCHLTHSEVKKKTRPPQPDHGKDAPPGVARQLWSKSPPGGFKPIQKDTERAIN